MHGRDPGKRLERNSAAVAVALLLTSLPAGARAAETSAPSESVVWVQKEVNFRYVGFTTKYSCDGLQDKMRRILRQLGARDDLKMIGYGCMRANSPETTPGVRIVMHVLQPASATTGPTVAARWRTVDLLADRNLLDGALDCELIAQIERDVLPLFAPRHVDYSAACSVNTPLIGGTRLKVDVLIPDSRPATASR